MELSSLKYNFEKIGKMVFSIAVIGALMQGVSAETIKVYPSDDVFTDSSNRNFNWGGVGDLRVGNDENRGKHRSFLKFEFPEISGNINDATINFTTLGGPVGGATNVELYEVLDSGWNEEDITWNNELGYETNLIDSKIVSDGGDVIFDVAEIVNTGDNSLSIALISEQESIEGKYVLFGSKEYSGGERYWPYLEIVYEEGGECNTNADVDCDGCVEMNEILDYISEWKIGSVGMGDLLESIGKWKSGEGC